MRLKNVPVIPNPFYWRREGDRNLPEEYNFTCVCACIIECTLKTDMDAADCIDLYHPSHMNSKILIVEQTWALNKALLILRLGPWLITKSVYTLKISE